MFHKDRRLLLAASKQFWLGTLAPLAVFSTLIFAPVPDARAQDQLWLHQFGSSRYDSASDVASDGVGGFIVTGWTSGDLAGPAAGKSDAFVSRYTHSGQLLWARQFGTNKEDRARSVTVDSAGNAYVGGYTEGNLVLNLPGTRDTFIARFDRMGNRVWTRQFKANSESGATLAGSDGNGGVIAVGGTKGGLGGGAYGGLDLFITHFDNAGNQLWLKQVGVYEREQALDMLPDGAGGVIIAGSWTNISGGSTFDHEDAFLLHLDAEGNQIWRRHFGTSENDVATGLAPDGEGGVFVSGYTEGSLGGPLSSEVDSFLTRFDGDGTQLWIRQYGAGDNNWFSGLAADGAGGVVATGRVYGRMAGPNAGITDAFIMRLDSQGIQRWARQIGTETWDGGLAIAPNGPGAVIMVGYTEGSLGRPNPGGRDVFLASYSIDSCYADCDRTTGSGVLDIFDFLCWQNDFVTGNSYACDCDMSTGPLVCDIFDFLCFQNAFTTGCP